MREWLMDVRGVRRRLSGVVLVGGLLVAGCSDADGEVGPTPEPSPDITATAEPTETESPAPGPTAWPEPTRPEAMERDDIEGAKAAAEYFLELFTYVHLTGHLERWKEISHPECLFCRSVAEEVEQLYARGGYADGPLLHIVDSGAAPPDDAFEFYSVWIDADEDASIQYGADGSVEQTSEAAELEIDLALERVAGEWNVRGVTSNSAVGESSDA